MNTHLNHIDKMKSVKHLETLLANTYVLAIKTQNYHWNVKSASFAMLHAFFENQYKTLFEAIDKIAERIRMLGQAAPASLREFLKLTTLSENTTYNETGEEMLSALFHDHEAIIGMLRTALKDMASSLDEGTIDFMVGRLKDHEKTAWMLRSHLPF